MGGQKSGNFGNPSEEQPQNSGNQNPAQNLTNEDRSKGGKARAEQSQEDQGLGQDTGMGEMEE